MSLDLLGASGFFQLVIFFNLFLSVLISASMLHGFLAWLELLLESGPPRPKRVPHGRPVKQTSKQTSSPQFINSHVSRNVLPTSPRGPTRPGLPYSGTVHGWKQTNKQTNNWYEWSYYRRPCMIPSAQFWRWWGRYTQQDLSPGHSSLWWSLGRRNCHRS